LTGTTLFAIPVIFIILFLLFLLFVQGRQTSWRSFSILWNQNIGLRGPKGLQKRGISRNKDGKRVKLKTQEKAEVK
jgi:hypothetical protein